MTFEDLRDQFETLTDLVRHAEGGLLSGSGVSDPADLDRRAQRLCNLVLSAEAQTARAVQPYLADLISALDSYAERLAEFKDRKGKGQ